MSKKKMGHQADARVEALKFMLSSSRGAGMKMPKPFRNPIKREVLRNSVDIPDRRGCKWRVCLSCGHRVRLRNPLGRPRR